MLAKTGLYAWPYPTNKTAEKVMTVSVPLCYLPNSKVQTFEVLTMRRSLYQIEYLMRVAQKPDFGYFVTVSHKGNPIIVTDDTEGPFHCMWYGKDGHLRTALVGRRETFPEVITPGRPIDHDSVVYRIRTE